MAFTPIAQRAGTTTITDVMVGLYSKSKNESCSLAIRLSAEVMAKLGWAGGDRVEVHEGTGTDAGCLQIVKAATRGHTISQWSRSDEKVGTIKVLSSRFPHHAFPQDPQPIETVTYQAFGGRLLIMLPTWAVPIFGEA